MNNQDTTNPIIADQADSDPHFVPISTYIRMRHELDLETDPKATPLYFYSVNKAILRGEMEAMVQGKFRFIDWNKYKNHVFRRFKQQNLRRSKIIV